MSAWKQFTTKDVTITPFTADKGFSITGSALTGSTVGINIFAGRNVNYSSSSNLQSGFVYSSSMNSIYNSAKQLYYKNYISSSKGDTVNTGSMLPGVTREDDRSIGSIESPLYENYLQSSLIQERNFPTGSGNSITTLAIPTKLYGEKIIPNTFEFVYTSSTFPTGLLLTDDGEGNIIRNFKGNITVEGQIFYSHGLVVLTEDNPLNIAGIGNEIRQNPPLIENCVFNFSSSLTIYEQQYKCSILENEFGFSTNPSLLTSSIEGASNQEYYPFVSASFFEPYITCVGLYNEAKQLVAVGKLSFPLPVSQFTDTTVIVNFDI